MIKHGIKGVLQKYGGIALIALSLIFCTATAYSLSGAKTAKADGDETFNGWITSGNMFQGSGAASSGAGYSSNEYYQSSDGTVAYCLQQGGISPNSSLSYVQNGYASSQIAWILDNGYPNTTNIGGYQLLDDEARQVTQAAVHTKGDSYRGKWCNITHVTTGGDYNTDALWGAYQYLINGCSAGSSTQYPTYSYPGNNDDYIYQNMVVAVSKPKLYVTLTKSSSSTITLDNPNYSLEGTTYELYKSDGTDMGMSFTVGADGKAAESYEVDPGDYYVVETVTGKNYKNAGQSGTITVTDANTEDNPAAFSVQDDPITVGVGLNKVSDNPNVSDNNPMYSLEGAKYSVTNTRTGESVGEITTDAKGHVELTGLPIDDYQLVETYSSAGYAINDTPYTVSASDFGEANAIPDGKVVDVPQHGEKSYGSNVPESPETVPPQLQKNDMLSDLGQKEGGATLENAVYEVKYYASTTVSGAPTRTWYIKTDANGHSDMSMIFSGSITTTQNGRHVTKQYTSDAPYTDESGNNVIPVGCFTMQEVLNPAGYLFDNDTLRGPGKLKSYTVSDDRTTTNSNVSVQNKLDSAVTDEDFAVRGDYMFNKKADDQHSMANVPFLVTSNTTGESHIIVTDENGEYDTSSYISSDTYSGRDADGNPQYGAEERPHSVNTNASDKIYDTNGDGVFSDEELAARQSNIDPDSTWNGLWFTGYANGTDGYNRVLAKVGDNDRMGALPYDTYTFKELPCESNLGYSLITFTVDVNRMGFKTDGGTKTDSAIGLSTVLLDPSTREHEIDASQGGTVKLTDEVTVTNATENTEYELRGALHYGIRNDDGTVTDGGVVKDANGNDVVVSKTFTAQGDSDTILIDMPEISVSDIGDKYVVAFEDLYQNGMLMAKHEDITDERQTVTFPTVHTNAHDNTTGGHDGATLETSTIIDDVTYTGLSTTKKYKIVGRLMDKETGAPIKDNDGNDVTVEKEFVPEAPDGTIQMQFDVPGSSIEGKTTVVFENVRYDDRDVTVHADINDEAQTVHYPKIHTTATDDSTGTHEGFAQDTTTITDIVDYDNLVKGQEYTMRGELYDKATGESLGVTAERKFIAGEDDDSTASGDEANENANANASNGNVINNANANSDESAGNTNTDDSGNVNGNTGNTSTTQNSSDDVKSDEPEYVSGTVKLQFTIEKSAIEGKTTVVFEDAYKTGDAVAEEQLVATHHNIDDTDQTVSYPGLHTTLTGDDGSKDLTPTAETKLTDVVTYTNLEPGKQYRIEGQLMDKQTGQPVDGAVAQATFVPDSADGTANITFTFNAIQVQTHDTVAFEELYKVQSGVNGEDIHVGEHADINDADQTVHFREADLADDLIDTDKMTQTGDVLRLGAIIAAASALATALIIRKRRMMSL